MSIEHIKSIFKPKQHYPEKHKEGNPIPGREYYRKVKEFVTKRPWIIAAMAAVAILLISTKLRSIVYILAFISIAIASKMSQVLFPFVVVLDIIVFMVVILTKVYGPGIAIMCGLVAYFLGTLLNSFFKHIASETYVGPPVGLILTGILTAYIPFGIVTTGMIATVFYAALMCIFYWMLYHDIFNEMTFLASILPLNYWLFANFGEKALILLG